MIKHTSNTKKNNLWYRHVWQIAAISATLYPRTMAIPTLANLPNGYPWGRLFQSMPYFIVLCQYIKATMQDQWEQYTFAIWLWKCCFSARVYWTIYFSTCNQWQLLIPCYLSILQKSQNTLHGSTMKAKYRGYFWMKTLVCILPLSFLRNMKYRVTKTIR